MQDSDDPRFRQTPPRGPARRSPRPDEAPADAPRERLQKVLADAGIASRRDCELAIRAGRVRVNGKIVRELPCLVRPREDLIEFDGEIVDTARRIERARRAHLYFAVHKPRGVISTLRDPEGRANVASLVAGRLPQGRRVYPVGRLDADSTGLVLLTDDGELAHRLAHPRYGIAKEYHVTAEGALYPAAIAKLRRGVFLAKPEAIARSKAARGGGGAKRAAFESLRVLKRWTDRRKGGVALLSIVLREGQNREIRRLLAHVGLKVRRLERVALGPLRLGALKPGAARELTADEVAALRAAVRLPANSSP